MHRPEGYDGDGQGRGDLAARLAAALRQPLPGAAAHMRLGVTPRPGWTPGLIPEDCRQAAGLVLIRRPGDALVLIERAAGLARHGGQISLPGGAVEPGEQLLEAALRETAEEIGLDPARANPLGALTPIHIPVSQFVLHPFVAETTQADWVPDGHEVARVIEIPLAELADPGALVVEDWTYEGRPYRVPLFLAGGTKVWGATGMILAELLCVLGLLDPVR